MPFVGWVIRYSPPDSRLAASVGAVVAAVAAGRDVRCPAWPRRRKPRVRSPWHGLGWPMNPSLASSVIRRLRTKTTLRMVFPARWSFIFINVRLIAGVYRIGGVASLPFPYSVARTIPSTIDPLKCVAVLHLKACVPGVQEHVRRPGYCRPEVVAVQRRTVHGLHARPQR